MIHKKPLGLAAALGFAVSLACAPVLAQEQGEIEQGVQQPEQQMPEKQLDLATIKYSELDENKDGKVSKDEFLRHGSQQQFDQVDKNGDGVITQQELRDAKQDEKQQEREMKQPQ